MRGHGSANCPSHAQFEQGDIEVDQQSETQVGKFQVGQQLALMDRQQLFDCLEFENYPFFNEKIESQSSIDPDSTIDNRYGGLSFVPDASFGQFHAEARFVDRFEQPRAEGLVNFESRIHQRPRKLLQFQRQRRGYIHG